MAENESIFVFKSYVPFSIVNLYTYNIAPNLWRHKLNDYLCIKLQQVDNLLRYFTGTHSSLLRIISQIYQWISKHLPLMLRSTELNTFDMTNTIYRDLLCRTNEA